MTDERSRGVPYVVAVAVPVAGWLNANDRKHWRVKAALTADWRLRAGWEAVRAKVPPLPRAHIVAELRFADRRRRDPANWHPTVKACVDGLVDVGVLPDDNAKHLLGPDLRLGPAVGAGRGAVVLHIWPRAEACDG